MLGGRYKQQMEIFLELSRLKFMAKALHMFVVGFAGGKLNFL